MTAPGPPVGLGPILSNAATAAHRVEATSTTATFAERLSAKTPASAEIGRPESAEQSGPSLLAEAKRFVEAVHRDRTAVDRAVARATEGHALTAGELLALQSRVYRFGQQVDLTAKVVEKSVGTVRRVIDLQV
jgi:hypothetical protein